ncbi:MAG: 4Fe-4S binding protein [Desulfobulbaceae bacterium]|nr:4Fe-4S binding protein [Desulfobulbaceae bacterium]
MQTVRKWVQVIWIFLANGFLGFPVTQNIYQGPMKVICSPGLNCYSCPAATTYCPIGSLQQLLVGVRFAVQSGNYYIGTFVVGFIGIFGATMGRFICGWACPFGLFQELLYKIPSRKFSIPRILNLLKYAFLLFFVIILPLVVVDQFGMGKPWFCKYVCPAGTLEAGLPLIFLMPDLRTTLGFLFLNKIIILIGFTIWSIPASRPFCRTTCPLGAFYALFNRYALIKLKLNEDACTKCGACHAVCPVEIRFNETPDSGECVNCMKCMTEACSFGAIYVDLAGYPILNPSTKKNLKAKAIS